MVITSFAMVGQYGCMSLSYLWTTVIQLYAFVKNMCSAYPVEPTKGCTLAGSNQTSSLSDMALFYYKIRHSSKMRTDRQRSSVNVVLMLPSDMFISNAFCLLYLCYVQFCTRCLPQVRKQRPHINLVMVKVYYQRQD